MKYKFTINKFYFIIINKIIINYMFYVLSKLDSKFY